MSNSLRILHKGMTQRLRYYILEERLRLTIDLLVDKSELSAGKISSTATAQPSYGRRNAACFELIFIVRVFREEAASRVMNDSTQLTSIWLLCNLVRIDCCATSTRVDGRGVSAVHWNAH